MATGGIVAIYSHPDDETFGVGGSMAHYAAKGIPVTMVCATRGEVGEISEGSEATPETLGQFRERELRDAMAILGVHDVRFLDYRDSGMAGTPENADPRNFINAAEDAVVEALVRILRERRPDIVVTWDESGGYGHPDHVAMHFRATRAFHAAADGGLYSSAGEPHSAGRLFYTSIPMAEFQRILDEMRRLGGDVPDVVEDDEQVASLPRLDPNTVIDVGPHYEEKMKAMLAHHTQITDIQPFMRLPDSVRRSFFGREWFFRAHPPVADGVMLDDFFT